MYGGAAKFEVTGSDPSSLWRILLLFHLNASSIRRLMCA